MRRVLIVEDQSDIRRLIKWSLEEEGYDMREAVNGSTGLAEARRFKPHLLVLDVMMPGDIDGLDLCRLVKADASLGPPRVLLLTARAQERDRRAGDEAGADGYLVKPFSPIQLARTVAELLKVQDEPGTA